ncbi:MAG: hypothetical protein ACKO7G_01345 [Gammaproteobacteria bacterium]
MLRSGVASTLVSMLATIPLVPTARADDLSAAQRRAAGEYLAAIAAGDAQSVAYAIHPDELDRLRVMLQQKLRAEAATGGDTLRSRLFGVAMPLADIERLTSVDLFRALGSRLALRGRVYEDLRGVGALRDGDRVLAVVKGRPPKERGTVEVVEVVPLLPYGREWKAAIPTEIEARLDDIAAGRVRRAGAAPGGATAGADVATGAGAGAVGGGAGGTPPARNTPGIIALLDAAERALVDDRCDRYYGEHLSPGLRQSLGKRALDTLVTACSRSLANRELLIAALRLVRRTPPVYDNGGDRAVYDLSGQGLPYDRYVLEQVSGRWYIAE